MKKIKEKTKDRFETQCWCYRIIADPYQVLAQVFSHAEMPHFKKLISKLLYTAEAEKMYTKKSPCDVLLYMKIIRSLMEAAYVLKDKKTSPIDVNPGDIFNKNYYCSNYQIATEWKDLPRFLSSKEFCNPYKAFRKFFKYKKLTEWLHDWEELVESALSKNAGGLGLEMTEVHHCLIKLVEAGHLINVREVNHIDGRLKSRFLGS